MLDDGEWVKVFECNNLPQATMIQSMLKENNIEAVILNQQDSFYVAVGDISVYVPLEFSVDAVLLIEQVNE